LNEIYLVPFGSDLCVGLVVLCGQRVQGSTTLVGTVRGGRVVVFSITEDGGGTLIETGLDLCDVVVK
jgi:hypothetical protein